MATEIEIKAWIRRPEETLRLIEEKCVFRKNYLKEDVYFHGPRINRKEQDVRVRRENGAWVCTYKEKTIRNGLEVNRETEFGLADGEALMMLLEVLGCREFLRKVKKGKSYGYEELTVEVSEVRDLGLFVEVERLTDAVDSGEVARTEEKIRGFLRSVGVREEDIEARPYAVMLAGGMGGISG